MTQSTTNRTTPDVAYDADPTTGLVLYDSDSNQPSLPWYASGGTGAAAAQWAALIAIADQGRVAAGVTTLGGPSQLLPALPGLPDGPRCLQRHHHRRPAPAAPAIRPATATTSSPAWAHPTGAGPRPRACDCAFATPPLPNTIYWTGDAGKNAAGNYDWDQAGNWSDVDPMVTNLPEDILPGPSDNVVIDLAGADITHSDATYDTISSLTGTAKNVTLNLTGRTLRSLR